MKHVARLGLLLGIMFFITGIQPTWADPTNITIDITSGSGGGFSYSGLHAASNCGSNNLCMGGARLYWSMTGTLNANLDTDGPITLANITGTLNGPQGSIAISNGNLSDPGGGGFASGTLDYTILTGSLQNETGTFYFVGDRMCCSNAINGGPNNLTATGFTLWGNNWDITAGQTRYDVIGTPLGMDLVGGQYTATPEPSTMLLLGSGLLALPFLRKLKR